MLLLTFPMVMTIAFWVSQTGELFFLVILGNLLLASLYAVAVLVAISREKVSSFLLGIALVLSLLIFDIEKSLLILLPDQIAEFLRFTCSHWSPKHWFQEVASGEITLAALIYFTTLCLVSLWISTRQFEALRQQTASRLKEVMGSLAVFIILVGFISGLVVVVSKLDVGVDVTEQREFTLSAQTIDIARSVPETTNIQLFFNKSLARAANN